MGGYSGGGGGGVAQEDFDALAADLFDVQRNTYDLFPVAGRYFAQCSGAQALSMGAAGDLKFQSFVLPACTIVSVTMHQSVAAAAGGVVRAGLYSGNGFPGTLLQESVAVATDVGAIPVTIPISLVWAGGRIWLGLVPQVAVPTIYMTYASTNFQRNDLWISDSVFPSVSNSCAYVRTGVTGALPPNNLITDLTLTGAGIPKVGILFG